jgi:GTP-binding protein EngB required for normal cell division
MNLRDYEQRKFAIAEVLRSAAGAVPSERREWHERAQDLFARIAEDRFNLVVVGRFNRGKTSLMNAIMSTNRLPMGIVPLTSVITTVGYGSKERAELHYEQRILTHEIPIDDLAKYVTQEGNPGNVKRIKKAEVQLPAEILRRGFYFVDTPGLGSPIPENTHTTESFLPEADAFLLVTSYESPLSDEEMRFFRAGSASARRIFVVLNKHDTVSVEERRTVLAYVRQQLSQIFGEEHPRIFSISARDGLDAKRQNDADRLKESGLPALESDLIGFLLTDKSTEFLLGMCARATNLVRDLGPSPATDALEEKIDILAKSIAPQTHGIPRHGRSLPGMPAGSDTVQQLHSCEICARINEALWNFLCRFQYDIGTRHDEQRRFAQRGGLCSFHTWQYESIASPQGTCAGFSPLVDRLAEELRTVAEVGGIARAIEDLASNPEGCAMCAVHAMAEAEAISVTARRLSKDLQSFDALSAICLPHLALLAAAIEDPDLRRRLLEREAAILERLSEDMKRYALKRDAVRRYLLTEEETGAAHRALLLLAGHRNVNATGPVHHGGNALEDALRTKSTPGGDLGRAASTPELLEVDPP